jgi:hypothetical protein
MSQPERNPFRTLEAVPHSRSRRGPGSAGQPLGSRNPRELRWLAVAILGALWTVTGCRDLQADPGFCAHCANDAGPRTGKPQAVTSNGSTAGSDDTGNGPLGVGTGPDDVSGAGGRRAEANAGSSAVPNDAGMSAEDPGAAGASSATDAQVSDARANPPPLDACGSTCTGRTPICLAASKSCVQCAENRSESCSRETPICDLTTHACVQCTETNHSACRGDTPVCDAATQRCVQCTAAQAEACTGTAPVCDPVSHSCVQCLEGSARACLRPTPVCNAQTHTCAQCNPGQSEACANETPVCEPTLHSCVQCIDNADCPANLARCNRANHTCEACQQDAACRRFSERPVCDDASGTCVACTSASEVERCGANPCVASTHTCSSHRKNSQSACAACETSSDCTSGLFCLPHVVAGQSLGNFCFPQRTSAGCGDINPDVRPYSRVAEALSTEGGIDVSYCVPYVSCRAVADAMSQKDCLISGLPDVIPCGDGQPNDGVCDASGKCTYSCENTYDCPGLDSVCSPAPAAFCELPMQPAPVPMPAPAP